MKRKNRILSLLMSGILVSGMIAGCGKGYKEEIPVYGSDDDFYISMWVGIPETVKKYDDNGHVLSSRPSTQEELEAQYKLAKEAGFNYVEGGYGEVTRQNNLKVLEMAEKYGMNCYVHDIELNQMLANDLLDDETLEEKIKSSTKDYVRYKSFAGIKFCDEPSINDLKGYDVPRKRAKKIFGEDKDFYVNLFPIIVEPAVLGGTYENYIKEYRERIDEDFIIYDHYPLKQDARGNNYILDSFLYNMDVIRKKAPDLDMRTFLQCIKYGGTNRDLACVADATFQVYSFLAYGGKGIQWFCYFSPPPFDGATSFGCGCFDRNNEKTAVYDYVKTANLEIRSLEDAYMNFDWKGVMPLIGSENDNGGENANFNYLEDCIAKHDRIESVKVQQDTLIGVFKDKENRDGFMVVNFTEPSAGLKNKVEFRFKDSARALVYKKGKREVADTKKGRLTFTMDAGEGYFVIPLR